MTDFLTIKLLAPEIVLVAVATIIYLAGAFARPGFRPLGFALAGICGAAIALLATRDLVPQIFAYPSQTILNGPLMIDLFGHTARWGILVAGAISVLLSNPGADEHQAAEYTGSLLLMIAGLMLAVAAGDLVLLFTALELVSIPTYVVLYLGKRGAVAQEATAKYFFLSILSSAILLYGFSFLYGLGGSTRLETIAAALQHQFAASGVQSPFIWVAAILILAGLAFRLAAVPFHFYAPDVFQGTSSANAGLLSTLPKIAGLLVLIRLAASAMPGIESLAWKFAWAMSVLTMTLGNIVALWQTNIRRLFAYSSIAHAGYMLIGVSVGLAQIGWAPLRDPAQVGGVNGLGSAVFYLAVYGLATLGTFAALTYLGNGRGEVNDIDELAGLAQRRPAVAAAIAVFMFSLAGVPPLAGFWGKFSLFSGAIDMGAPIAGNRNELEGWFLALAIVGVLNAAIAAAYYLRVVATMYFRAPASATDALPAARNVEHNDAAPAIATALCTALVIIAGILPGGLLEASNAAGTSVSDRSSARQTVAEPSQAALLSDPASLNAPSAP